MKTISLLSMLLLCLTLVTSCIKDDPSAEPEPTSLKIGLVAHFPLNGNADDIGTSGLKGTVTGTTIDSDRFGKPAGAYYFDGEDDIILYDKPELLGLGGRNPYTMSVWVKPEYQDKTSHIISKFNGGISAGWYVGINKDSVSQSYRNAEPWATYGTTQINFDKYVHLLTIYDGVNLMTYVNGELDSSTAFFSHPNDVKTRIVIGGLYSRNVINATFKGSIDDIRIYNRVLEAEEIEWLVEH